MTTPSLPYNLLKLSLQMYQCPPRELDTDAYETVQNRAKEECYLQKKNNE